MILQNIELRSRLAPALASWSTGIGRWFDERRWNLSFATKNLSTPDHNPAPRRVDRQTHSDRGQPYRLLVTSESRSVAQEALNLLWREFGGADLRDCPEINVTNWMILAGWRSSNSHERDRAPSGST